MNLTPGQILGGSISTLSVVAGASTQLTMLFGQAIANDITAACVILSAILGGWVVAVTGQSAVVKQVAAMPGVENININSKANETLAAVAADPTQTKVKGSLK